MRSGLALACLCVLLLRVDPASAQLSAAKDGPVVYGRQIVTFPNVLVFLREQTPTGGSIGTTADHLGLAVPDLRPVIDKLKAGGHRMITRDSVPADWAVIDDITRSPAGGRPIAFVLGPDDLKVELVQIADQAAPAVLHHVHFFGPDRDEMQAWYVKVFGARAGAPAPGARFLTAALPGVSLNFSASPRPVVGTKGRVVDHVGFEIDDLPTFLGKLDAMGVTPENVRQVPDLGISIAFITDPWGTVIELTEGLDTIP